MNYCVHSTFYLIVRSLPIANESGRVIVVGFYYDIAMHIKIALVSLGLYGPIDASRFWLVLNTSEAS
jgi:hypothetical protein